MVTASRLFEGSTVASPGPGTLYTCPVNQHALIKKITFTNTTAGAVTLNVYLVASGGAAGAGNAVGGYPKTLAPGEDYELYSAENHLLNPSDFIAAGASAAGITAHASGMLFT